MCYNDIAPCGRGVKYAHRFPTCRVRRLKGYPDGSAPTAGLKNGMLAQNAATILKPLVPNPRLTPFTHGATCCWLNCTIPRSQHSLPPPLKFLYTPPSPPPSPSFLPLCVRELGAIIIILPYSPFTSTVKYFHTLSYILCHTSPLYIIVMVAHQANLSSS